MKFYMAPMEGLTTFIYRNTYEKYYGGIDKYFAPFIVASTKRTMSSREKRDILPENNVGIHVVPQILANDSEAFLRTLGWITEMGYKEVNLNLGCPSGTVVSKGRGAGFLYDTFKLERFLDEIYEKADVAISIKTRIGRYEADEFEELLNIYNRHPVSELIIHPRTREDFYKNTPDLDTFARACERSRNPVCYNGDIHSVEDYEGFTKRFPEVDTMMLGRGILFHPSLVKDITGNKASDVDTFRAFHDELLVQYEELLSGDRNILFKMKELWSYFQYNFEDCEKQMKKIKKAESISAYKIAVTGIFEGYRY